MARRTAKRHRPIASPVTSPLHFVASLSVDGKEEISAVEIARPNVNPTLYPPSCGLIKTTLALTLILRNILKRIIALHKPLHWHHHRDLRRSHHSDP